MFKGWFSKSVNYIEIFDTFVTIHGNIGFQATYMKLETISLSKTMKIGPPVLEKIFEGFYHI